MTLSFYNGGDGEQQILSIFRGISEFSRPLSCLQSRLNGSSSITAIAEGSSEELKEQITKAN